MFTSSLKLSFNKTFCLYILMALTESWQSLDPSSITCIFPFELLDSSLLGYLGLSRAWFSQVALASWYFVIKSLILKFARSLLAHSSVKCLLRTLQSFVMCPFTFWISQYKFLSLVHVVGFHSPWNGVPTLLLDGLKPNLFSPWLSLGSNFFGGNVTVCLACLFFFAKLSFSSSTSI